MSYDDDVYGSLGFVGTDRLVERIIEFVEPSERVLDVGCGTGAVGERLARHGFVEIDGLDLSPKMLRVAHHKGVYRQLSEADLNEPLALAGNTYDAVVSAGTFVSGHVGAGVLGELVRATNPGGVLAFTVMDSFWEAGGFSEKIDELQSAGALAVEIDELVAAAPNGSSKTRIVVLRTIETSLRHR